MLLFRKRMIIDQPPPLNSVEFDGDPGRDFNQILNPINYDLIIAAIAMPMSIIIKL